MNTFRRRNSTEMINCIDSQSTAANLFVRMMLVPCSRKVAVTAQSAILPNESFKHETYGNVLVCHCCGLIKRRTDFPLLKRNKQECCRVCSYMKENSLGWKHCKCCGELKPKVAFSKTTKGMMKRCRPCMTRVTNVAEIV
jgi:hypothetical protein